MAASLNILCEGSEDSSSLLGWSLCSRVIAVKCPSPTVPLWAAWEHDAFCSLVLAAVHVPCVSVSPGEISETAPRQLISEMRPGTASLDLQHGCLEGPYRRQGVHVKASDWDTGKEWKQKSVGEVWLLWCSELLADPDVLVVGVVL